MVVNNVWSNAVLHAIMHDHSNATNMRRQWRIPLSTIVTVSFGCVLLISMLQLFYSVDLVVNNRQVIVWGRANPSWLVEPTHQAFQSSVKGPSAAIKPIVHALPPNSTHWCIIAQTSMSRTSRRFHDHFPHAAENILPCWSWFRETRSTNQCGFALMYGLTFRSNPNAWHNKLVEAMGCKVKHVRNVKANRKKPFKEEGAIFHTPNLKLKQPRYGMVRYLARPEDGHALRWMLVKDDVIAKVKGLDKPLQVGILQRTTNRVITNLEQIRASLAVRIQQETEIHMTTLNNASLEEQATWFATKDVIIAAHGAALVNCLFITPGTIVLQLYPPNYFFQSLEPLIEQVGGVALDWYNGTDPIVDWRSHRDSQLELRTSNITPPVNEIVDLILMGIGEMETPSGWFPRDKYLETVIQSNWTKVLQWMGDV
jgi:hypothetical protein